MRSKRSLARRRASGTGGVRYAALPELRLQDQPFDRGRFEERLSDAARASDERRAFGQALPGEEVAGVAAGLPHEQYSRQAIPRIDVILDITVAPPGCDIGKAQRARAGADYTSAGGGDASEQIHESLH